MDTTQMNPEPTAAHTAEAVLAAVDEFMTNLHTPCMLTQIRAMIRRCVDNKELSDDDRKIIWAIRIIVKLAKLMEWTDEDPVDDAAVLATAITMSQMNEKFLPGQQIFADAEGPIGMIARLVTMLQASTLTLHAGMLKCIDISNVPVVESPEHAAQLLEKMKAIVTKLNGKCNDAGLNPIAPTLVKLTGFPAEWGALADTIRKLLDVLRRHHLQKRMIEACSTLSVRSITEREEAYESKGDNVLNDFTKLFRETGNALRLSILPGTPSTYPLVSSARFYLHTLIDTGDDWMAALGKSVLQPAYTGSKKNARIGEAWIRAALEGYTVGPVELSANLRAKLEPMRQKYQQAFKGITVHGSASSIASHLSQISASYGNVVCYNTSLVLSIDCHPPMVIAPAQRIISVGAFCQSLTCHTIPDWVVNDLKALVEVLPGLLGISAYKTILNAHMADNKRGTLKVLLGIRLDTLEFLLEFWSQAWAIDVSDRKAYKNFKNVLTILSKILVPGGANPNAKVKAHSRKGEEYYQVTVEMDPRSGELSAAFCSAGCLGTIYLMPTVKHDVRDTSKIELLGFTSGDVSMQMDLVAREICRLLELQLAKLLGNHTAGPLDGVGVRSHNTTETTDQTTDRPSSHKRMLKTDAGAKLTHGLVQQEAELENARAEIKNARAELEIATQRIKSLEEEKKQLCRRLKRDNDEDTDLGDDTDSDDDTINQPPKRRKVPAPATDDPYKPGDTCWFKFRGKKVEAKILKALHLEKAVCYNIEFFDAANQRLTESGVEHARLSIN